MTKVLMSLGGWLLTKVPLERLVAYGLNYLLDKLTSKDASMELYQRVIKTIGHIAEALAVSQALLVDGKISEDEAQYAAGFSGDLRKKLLELWANGESGKEIEAQLGK